METLEIVLNGYTLHTYLENTGQRAFRMNEKKAKNEEKNIHKYEENLSMP